MTEPIKACVDVDLRVAKLAGIRARLSRRYSLANGWSVRCCRIDKPGVQFSPTTNPADAIEAARAILRTDRAVAFIDRLWHTGMKLNHNATHYAVIRNIFEEKFCMKICEAILTVKGNSDE